MRRILSVALMSTILAACATSPDKIKASYVSPLQYSDYDCDQLRGEMIRVSRHVEQVTGQQRSDASDDSVAMGVGLVLFWPALFFIGGNEHRDELARLKGEYEALDQTAIQKKCTFAEQLRQARLDEAARQAEAKSGKNKKKKRKDEPSPETLRLEATTQSPAATPASAPATAPAPTPAPATTAPATMAPATTAPAKPM